MNEEMPRLLDGELSELERRLLQSAGSDAPSAEAAAQAAGALGLGSAVAHTKWGVAFKWGFPAVLALGLVGAAQLRSKETARTAPSEVEPVKPPRASALASPGLPTAPAKVEDSPRGEEMKAPSRAVPSAPPKTSSIADELRKIEEARRALATGKPKDALRLVAEYRRAYPKAALREEADVIRIAALDASGRRNEARAEARVFLSAHPKSPHRARLERIVAGPQP